MNWFFLKKYINNIMKKIIWVILAVLIVGGTIYYFTRNNKNNVSKEIVKIGVILPLTGPVAEPGNNVLRGINVAIEKFNLQNEPKIMLIVEDSKSNPKDGVTALNKLINADNVKIIIGDIMSSVFLACAPIAEKNRITMISPGASNPEVKNAGDYIFRIYPSDEYDGEIMAKFIFNKLKYKTALIINVNNDYGFGVSKRFKEVFNRLGGNILETIPYTEGQNDFKTISVKIKQANPEMIYVIGNPGENGNLINELKKQNIHIPISGNLSFENETFLKIATNSFDSIYYSSPYFDIERNDEDTKLFVKTYNQKYSQKPDIAASLGYDVAMILLDALQKINFDVSKLNISLYSIKDYDGITGKTSFDKNGDVQKSIYVKQIKNSGEKRIIEIFQP